MNESRRLSGIGSHNEVEEENVFQFPRAARRFRYQVDLPPSARDELVSLQEGYNRAGPSEILRDALTLYVALMSYRAGRSRKEILLRDIESGEVTSLSEFF